MHNESTADALMASEERFRLLTEAASHLVWTCRADGQREYLSAQWGEYTGLPKEQQLGYGWLRALHPDDRKPAERRWREAVETELPVDLEYRIRRHDGEYRWFKVRALPLRDASGKVTRWLGTSTDIEDDKRYDADITRWEVLERQLLDKNQSLREQNERASDASRAKSLFLAAMSHEIRTPMNALLGMIELLMGTDLTPEQLNYTEVARRAGENLLGLINDILDLTKIEAGQFELEQVEFSLDEIVSRCIELVYQRAHAKGVNVTAKMEDDLPGFLVGDPVRLQQVLINLLGNASKFTDAGRITLEVGSEPLGDNVRLRFSVTDTGIGIPSEKLQLIFEDFAQADSSVTRHFGGTGLGLSISKRLVQLFGGELSVKSAVGKGSTFTFSAVFPVAAAPRIDHSEILDFKGRRAIVIDDDETNRLILTRCLSSWGFEPCSCPDAASAIETLEKAGAAKQPFSLALLDDRLPDGSGFETYHRLRRVAPELPVILLTSDGLPGSATQLRALGLAGYGSKPINRTNLLRLVCQAMGGKDPGPSDSSRPTDSGPGSAHTLSGKLVLVAEDSLDNQILLRAYLKETGAELRFVENGQKAVDAFRNERFDMVLMDLQMPVMDGHTATILIREIEAKEGRTRTPILAVSANAFRHDAEASLKVGCDAHISKPVSKAVLLRAMTRNWPTASAVEAPETPEIEVDPELAELTRDYLDRRRTELPKLRELWAGKDGKGLRFAGHNIKGAAAGYGFPELSRIGADMENNAKQSDFEAISHDLQRISQFLASVRLKASPQEES